MDRRTFLKSVALTAGGLAAGRAWGQAAPLRPNVIFILADDMGCGDLGCYGQKKIRTPNIDALAQGGLRFTQAYAGAPVCAPSRCALLTGLHMGHAYIRDNKELKTEGQIPIPDSTVTVAEVLRQAGYTTACIGKWGLGGPGSEGEPNRQGFDHYFGYLCQREAHRYYPQHLWRNGRKVVLEGNADGQRRQYAHDLLTEEALKFLRQAEAGRPLFLYLPYTIPHVDLDVPEDSLRPYLGQWEEKPFAGNHYRAHPTPRAAYAGMLSRLDGDVGRLMAVLKERGLEQNTLVMFASDNGPATSGGADLAFFNGAAGRRGRKGTLFEGGIRVPLIARWPGRIRAGSVSDHVCAFWDLLPTLAELAGAEAPAGIDGLSFLPTLLGDAARQKRHTHLYWEHFAGQGSQAVRMGDWKGVRLNVKGKGQAPVQLFNLRDDPAERQDVADKHPEIAAKVLELMTGSRVESEIWPLLR